VGVAEGPHGTQSGRWPPTASEKKTRILREQAFDEPFFQVPADAAITRGARGPLSKQTAVGPVVKEAGEQVREELGFDYDVETCSSRQRTFIWQVSQPAIEKNSHLANQRYT
jgi:hypothetical protein